MASTSCSDSMSPGSMQALDFKIGGERVNRIDVVKSVVSKFIDERPDDRIGVVAFAGAPYLVSPLTLDHDWLAAKPGSRHGRWCR